MLVLLRWMVIFPATAFSVAVGFLYFNQERMIFPAPTLINEPVSGASFDVVDIKTPDGETLQSLFHPAESGETTVIVFHGNGSAAAFQRHKGNALVEAGFGVLLAEYRGYGGSTGSPTESGLFLDGMASYDFVADSSDGPIAIYAHSLGTGIGIHVASNRSVSKMVLESPFDSLLAVAQDRYPWAPVGPLLKHPFRSDLQIGKLSMPILILHGDKDRVVPFKHGEALMKLAPDGTEFFRIEGGGHNNLASFGAVDLSVKFLKNN